MRHLSRQPDSSYSHYGPSTYAAMHVLALYDEAPTLSVFNMLQPMSA